MNKTKIIEIVIFATTALITAIKSVINFINNISRFEDEHANSTV